MPEVLIAIQARSGSKRLPGKSLMVMDDKTMVAHVFQSAQIAASHINKATGNTGVSCKVCLVIPKDDPLKEHFLSRDIIEGPEDDVLERYRLAYLAYNPDYMVRITGDCPLIIPTIIAKHIASAVGSQLDYCSNAYEEIRTFVDGYDVEVISAKALEWLFANVASSHDKEHVTTLLRSDPPRWVRFGVVIAHIDLSDIKLSVDTIADFEEVCRRKKSLDEKNRLARERGYDVFKF
jgi:spore coat polysaccharide biosynthesis protein SpsF (cytidylyltransferase family)